ncbi:hypothetical protein [Peribacillus frigoritolerans]|uniref:hypothetical protein n=1 Tax=Peribacillus frigoritolerans TaxID=450367 RepID=UPI0013A5C875|nr:hypothetical protein [Peribacillus frigoritolerans]
MNVSMGLLITLVGLLCTATGVVLGLFKHSREIEKKMSKVMLRNQQLSEQN